MLNRRELEEWIEVQDALRTALYGLINARELMYIAGEDEHVKTLTRMIEEVRCRLKEETGETE